MKTIIKFYSGIHTIGGVIMSIEYGSERILLEAGTSYEPALDVFDGYVQPRKKEWLRDDLRLHRVPAIEGVYRREDLGDWPLESAEESSLHTTAFISHLHLDHMSLMGSFSDEVDIYLSDAANNIESALETVGMGISNIRSVPYKQLTDHGTLHFGEIEVTPFLLCRQSYQDWSFYVKTPDVKLHYTGDLVLHGEYKDSVINEMQHIRQENVDILVCEATTFMDSTLKMVYGRTDVTVEPDINLPENVLDKTGLDLEMYKILKTQKGLCVFNFYEREMADAAVFNMLAQKTNRIIAYEPETAYIVWKFFKQPVNVYIPDVSIFAQSEKPTWFLELTNSNAIISKNDIFLHPDHYMIQNSYKYSLELFSLPNHEASYLHAGGTPIGNYDPAYENLMKILRISNFNYITFFAKNYFSHAYPCQVKYYVDQIDAKILIPSHSQNPERLLPPEGRIQFIPKLMQKYFFDGNTLQEII